MQTLKQFLIVWLALLVAVPLIWGATHLTVQIVVASKIGAAFALTFWVALFTVWLKWTAEAMHKEQWKDIDS